MDKLTREQIEELRNRLTVLIGGSHVQTVCDMALSALTADAGMERAAEIYDAGFRAAADWAGVDHILFDMDSDKYDEEREAAIRAASAQVNAEDVVICELCNGPVSPNGHDCGPSAPDAGQVVVPVETLGNLLALIHQANCAAEILRAAGSRQDG